MPAGCWNVAGWVAVLQTKLFGRKAAEAFQKSTFPLRCRSTSRQGGDTLGRALCTGGLTPAGGQRLLNDLVPEGTCTASRGSLSETTDWLDIEVRRWDTKVVPRPAFLIQLGPDKTGAGKTTNQIRWQFSTVSNYCCGKGGPDKINQTWERFNHSWFFFFFPFFPFLLSEDTACLVNANTGSSRGVPHRPWNKTQGLIYGLDYWETVILCSLWCFVGRCSTLQSEQRDCNEVFTKGVREGGWWWVRQLL